MRTDKSTEKEARETIHRIAADAFSEHVLVPEGEGRWFCHRPNSSAYWFRVVSAPGHLIVFGDVGDAILRASDRDMVSWVAGAVRSPDYLFEKVIHKDKTLYVGDVMADLDERVKDDPKAAAVKEELEERLGLYDALEPRDWYEAWSEQGVGGSDAECPEGWSSSMWWTYECLAWFSKALDATGRA